VLVGVDAVNVMAAYQPVVQVCRVLRRIFGSKRDEVQEHGVDYMTRRFMICFIQCGEFLQ
jgi:hypothetical protein